MKPVFFYMKLAFKKSQNKIIDILIDKWTALFCDQSGFCHVELIFDNNQSFSANPEEGVRFKEIKYSHPERWIFVDLDIFDLPEKVIYERAKKIDGAAYDWIGIFLYELLPLKTHCWERFYCSEAISYILDLPPYQKSPNRLFRDFNSMFKLV